MNIEQKLEFIQKALEMGAVVQVKFHGIPSKQEAERIAAEFSGMLEIPYEESENKETYWFNVRDSRKGVDIAVFYELSKAEKQAELLKQLAKLNTDEEETA
jgi:hypothetical protein